MKLTAMIFALLMVCSSFFVFFGEPAHLHNNTEKIKGEWTPLSKTTYDDVTILVNDTENIIIVGDEYSKLEEQTIVSWKFESSGFDHTLDLVGNGEIVITWNDNGDTSSIIYKKKK